MKAALLVIVTGLFVAVGSSSALADLACDVDFDNGASLQFALSDSGQGQYLFRSVTTGLAGHCTQSGDDYTCTTSQGDLLEIRPSEHRYQDQTIDGQTLQGSLSCEPAP
jgi:hypothetical protein